MKSQTIDFKRQVLLFNPKDFAEKLVAIVGLGNIGSHTALALARLGIQNLDLYDFDHVEPHNLASQAYDRFDLKHNKVDAMREKILRINPEAAVLTNNKKYDPNKIVANYADIVVIAVDSMKARKQIAKMFETSYQPKLWIDARIGGNQLELYNIRSVEEWKKTFSDNPSTDPCGGRYISYVSVMIAGLIANQVKKFLKDEPMDKSIIMDANTLQVIKDLSWE